MRSKSEMHSYQLVSSKHIVDNTHCGLILDMGLGKTVSTLTAINELMFEELDIIKPLVVAPKRVAINVWPDEVKEWEHLKHLSVSVIAGTEKERKRAIAKKANIYTIGRDNIAWLVGIYGGSKIPFDALIIDESSSFKNHKSNRFKALKQVQPNFKRVVLLTGTPTPNGLIDLWAQIYLLDRGKRLSRFITRYREDYFKPRLSRDGTRIFGYDLKKGCEKKIKDKISDICISMKKEDYLRLPDCIYNDISIKFPTELQEKYEDFRKEKILEIFEGYKKGDVITALNASALSVKLLQFANGAIYDEDKEFHAVHDLKLEALEEIMDTVTGKPVLLAWSFRHDMIRIKQRLKRFKPVSLDSKNDIQVINDWNKGKIQLLLMYPASGGHGLNLQYGGHTLVWFGQTWNAELYEQFNARLDRQGQKEKVIIHRLIAENTEEKRVVSSLKNKINNQDVFITSLKADIEKYLNLR